MRALVRIALSLAALVALGSCATLTEEECRAGDWRQIGVADGAEGYGSGRLDLHRRACADTGVVPDAAAWARGRAEGLRLYCTPARAYRVAREGRTLREGCTAAELARLRPAYEHGRAYWRYEMDIQSLRSDIRAINREISRRPPGSYGFLYSRRMMLLGEINIAEMRQRRYATWP